MTQVDNEHQGSKMMSRQKLLLVRYNELGLKSPRVRRRFQRKLVENIENGFMNENLECIIDSQWGRILVHTEGLEKGVEVLTRIFGVSSVSVAEWGDGGLEKIIDSAVDYAGTMLRKGHRFAIRARRYGQHDFTSMELAEKIGTRVLDKYKELELGVKLKGADVEIHVEVRHKNFYLFSERHPGVGGLPLGTQGRVLGIYENDTSFLAWWLIMKRGATVIPIYLTEHEIPPGQDPFKMIDDDDFKENFKEFQRWSPGIKLRTYMQEKTLVDGSGDGNRSIFSTYLELMNNLSGFYKADGIVSGIGIETFTRELEAFGRENLSEHPIFFPLIGLDKEDVAVLKNTILRGTKLPSER